MATFGERLAELRREAGLNQAQLAEQSGVPLGTLRQWEQNRREPSFTSLRAVAKALGTTCSAFEACEFLHEPQPSDKSSETAKPKGKLGRPRKLIESQTDTSETPAPHAEPARRADGDE